MTGYPHDLAAAYAVDALDPEERRVFEAHYPDCETCAHAVAEMSETLGALAASDEEMPSADVKRRLMILVGTTEQLPPPATSEDLEPSRVPEPLRPRRATAMKAVLLAAAAVVLVVAGILGGMRLADDNQPLETVLSAPDTVVSNMTGPEGTMQVLWSPSQGEIGVIASDLPDPGPDKAYELWYVMPDGVARAAVLSPEDGSVREVVKSSGDHSPVGWAVTVEPKSGVDQPTGEPVMKAEI